MSIRGNLEKWRKIERAKHRVLHDCQRMGLPVGPEQAAFRELPLRFAFKSSDTEPVSTGHANGLITLELSEADSIKREQSRVEFNEPQRTLVGHFRHELGHYYWRCLLAPDDLTKFRALFGDEKNPTYSNAKEKYYHSGPPTGWQDSYISQYAAMHPWEDFAETFNAYLDMQAVVGTSNHFPRLRCSVDLNNCDALIAAYTQIGILANEWNRDIGLLDLVPEIFTPTVRKKLHFVHQMRETAMPANSFSEK